MLESPLPENVGDCRRQIARFCEAGRLKEAMKVFSDCSNVQFDVDTYCSLLQLCAERKSLDDGKRIEANVCHCGIEQDGVLGAKLVFMYLKCGDLKEGRRVFDGMVKRSVFLWNLIMNEYAKAGDYEEAVSLFVEMQRNGVRPDSYSFSGVLKSCSALESIRGGQQVHDLLTKSGFHCYVTVGNALISFYSRCGRIECAQKVFAIMPERDVISWNATTGGLLLNGRANEAIKLFREMKSCGVKADLATMVTVLPASAELGYSLYGKEIHGHALRVGLKEETTFCNSLLDMYAKCGKLEYAIRVFDRMPQKTVVSWTSMISGYARDGQLEKAIQLFNEMELSGVRPDLFTVTSVLHACSSNGSLKYGKDIHGYIERNGFESNLFVANALMDMYAKCRSMEDAQSIFNRMSVRDIVSWNTVIGGYSKNHLPNEALILFSQMQKEVKTNGVTMACTLPACASLSSLERGREIHGHIVRNGYHSDGFINNALIDMYAKCGDLDVAKALFDRMSNRDLVSWTAMIAGYGMNGNGEEAISLFNQMKEAGIRPDEVSFIPLLYACSHTGLVEEGWRLFDSMRNDHGIVPKVEHYACMVDLLGRAGQLKKAYQLIQEMPIKPDSTVWGALLCACRLHRDVKLAEKVAEKVFELEPENTGFYVLLSNIYAEAEEWESVKKLRAEITSRRLKKNPGCSWIEIKGKTNLFVAGDRSKLNSKDIQTLLKKVKAKMKEEGYTPNKRYALLDLDDQGKEDALCDHSEKLAMAFGLLKSQQGKPIRVTKNLRVCGDCHEVAKFMSKSYGREIILRDSSRFHHFKDGRCSCRGYWYY
ncbi:Pentatricopeptide repeat-containing protein [Nymphaea thermarum]|nr:Pentatricopeptide repeat-containing protein [Nymphaea thermarum]